MTNAWRLLCVCCFTLVAGAANAAERIVDHVVLITVDGLPAYMVDNPSAVLTNIRSLAERGARAEGSIVSNPSVTWPNHTTLVTGVTPAKHGVIFNGVLERPGLGLPVKINPAADKTELVGVPTLYDRLNAAGLVATEINWPCTRGAESLAVRFPDTPNALEHTTPALLAELKETGVLTDDLVKNWSKLSGPARDRIWTLAASHVIKTRKPNLLLFHLLNVDGTHHKYGSLSPASYSAVAYADACVGELLKAIDEAGIADRTAVLLTSDHGFISIPKQLNPNVLFKQAGLLTVRGTTVETARAYAVPEGGTALVYFTVPDTAEADRKKAIELFKDQEGIAAVLTPESFAEYGLPIPADSRKAPDLVLAAKEGYGFSGAATGDEFVKTNEGTPGTHGYLSTEPKMNALFVAAGAGIKPGARTGTIRNTSIAPTIAKLLGVDLPGADGKPLDEILATPTEK